MPRGRAKRVKEHHGILAVVEQQYLAALKFSRDQIDRRIKALEAAIAQDRAGEAGGGGGGGGGAAKSSTSKPAARAAATGGGETRKPRNYELLKAKITRPMTILEMLKALGMKEKQEGTLRQVMQNYPGLFTSDGKRPATYTLDTSR